MKHNEKRKENYGQKSKEQLTAIARSGSLSSSCAQWNLWNRFKIVVPTDAEKAFAEKQAQFKEGMKLNAA